MSVLRCHGSLELGARWRGGEESSKCISSLASGVLKRRAGRGGDVGRHTRAKHCQKRDKKEGEMIKKLPQPPCQCTCLFSGTRPSKGLNLESVNTYKHSVHVHGLTHTQLYALKVHALTSHFICRFQVT